MGLPETTTVKDGDQTYTTRTFYDDMGRSDYVIDTEGGVTSYEYDCAGSIISRKEGEPEELSVQYKYYPNGKLNYAIDAVGKKTTTSLSDPNQNAGISGKNPTYAYTYDEKTGMLLSETNAIGNTAQYAYNSNLLLEEMTDSAGEKTAYTYDSLNRLKKVKDGLGTIEY